MVEGIDELGWFLSVPAEVMCADYDPRTSRRRRATLSLSRVIRNSTDPTSAVSVSVCAAVCRLGSDDHR